MVETEHDRQYEHLNIDLEDRSFITPDFTLKNVMKVWDVEVPQRMRARNVVRPPLRTAGPIFSRLVMVLSSRLPLLTTKLCPI